MNYSSYLLCLFLLLFSRLGAAQNTVQLFNGTDLEGWYAYEPESGKHPNATDLFTVEDGMIRLYGSKAGYLMSKESFRDFKLTAEFRWNTDTNFIRKMDNRNSGIMYLVPSETPDELWPKGIQFQIKEGATGDFILLQEVTLTVKGERTEPGRSVVAKRFKDAAKPAGEWNTIVITFRNGEIEQMLNGIQVNKGTDPSVSEGRILLQYEGYPIDFRKVEIEKF